MSQRKTRPARRPPARSRQELPVLPMVVGGVFVLVLLALVVIGRIQANPISGQTVANIRCETGEQLAVHYHAHLALVYKGQPVTIPAQVGITSTCLYWIHTHQESGIIHIEAPGDAARRVFTVGDFFAVWGQPITSRQVATFKIGAGDQVRVWVDGQPYSGDPAGVPLKSHTQVVIEIGPPFQDPPPSFNWNDPAVVQEAGSS